MAPSRDLLQGLRPSPLVGLLYGLTGALLALSVACWTWTGPPAVVTAASFLLPALWLVVLVPGLVLALTSRTPRPARILLLAQLALVGLVWGRAWVGVPGWGGVEPFTAMSWNVQRLGWDGPERGQRVDCVVAAIEEADPAVLTLLEVTAEDVAELSARLDLRCEHVDYRGTGRADLGGLAACSRGEQWDLGLRAPRQFSAEERWFYVFTEVTRAGPEPRTLNLMAVHLPPYGVSLASMLGREGSRSRAPEDTARRQQDGTEGLIRRVRSLKDPTVVAGDFNSGRDAALHVSMRRQLRDVYEQAAWGPGRTVWAFDLLPLRIDYVYVTRDFVVRSAEIPAVDCADHRPVVSEVAWRR